MALHVSNAQQVNGTQSASAEEEELYDQLLRLRDSVIAGTHPQLKLSAAAIDELLKAQRHTATATAEPSPPPVVNGFADNGVAFDANGTTNAPQSSIAPTFAGLPGLQAPSNSLVNNSVHTPHKPSSSGTLDPIFLEKSDSLVRAEGQLKRQRIERELQTQYDQRKPAHGARDKDAAVDAPVALDVEDILVKASAREPHLSGLMPPKPSTPSSFDENDYYSSQVESEWSSPESASKVSDRAAGADFTGFHETSNGASASHVKTSNAAPQLGQSAKDHAVQVNNLQSQGVYHVDDDDDDDDEYDPEDVPAFASFPNGNNVPVGGHVTPPEDDDDSEYEPGEITQESAVPTPYEQRQPPSQPSPQVPVIRNHLTHIAAPQPNRVSPLAVAKRPSIELELINGRPEVVQKSRPKPNRASTGSPPYTGTGAKKGKKKKRKRDQEPTNRNNKKSRRERNAAAQSPPSPAHNQPYIKDEPISPPPFANVPEVQPFGQRAAQYRPAEIDLVSPRHIPQSTQYAHEAPRSGLRYEYAAPASPAVVQVASPAHRAVHRDTQDLRRVASLHYAQRPSSPAQRAYSPAPSRTVSMTYGDPRLSRAMEVESPQYQEPVPPEAARDVRHERSRSPPRLQEYQDPYARVSSPAMLPPPPAAPPRRIVVDQYGNRYYAAEPAPIQPPPPARASVAPVERRPAMEFGYERAPSRMATTYGQAPTQYEAADRMAPPPSRRPIPDERTAYVDAGGYRVRDYEPPSSQVRYVEAPTSPTYQPVPAARYETMAPPPPPSEPTSPVYAPIRSYSVRPEESAPMPTPTAYAPRQASVAPVQYARQEPSGIAATPTRAMSVMPGYEQPTSAKRAYSHAPAQVRYLDQYGREVFPSEVRQMPAADYRYQQ
ncbi:hypothetical protein M409DRAFT_70135 [Zasmidium cellare ATCC 36951]|uniref:Uncharacterized protein n=1 Tax=Zasmidium cellare ATCC 36951 TaxID=1080233 RepID=A0A6A6C3E6_ZASCE|nr:uncharacterized protein M409DRAFT_70135 [Zasmidium cellare ATCC 36951]KAF2160808.1 hypothetical protein M409DRAFT_70135 [Zasmidium cellare ATCC 36951]